jgi:alpha-tubulin suppressor-like RCC1 family protein
MPLKTKLGAILIATIGLYGCNDSDNDVSEPPVRFTVTAAAGTGGSVSLVSAAVTSGQKVTVTVTADSGYTIAAVTGCGGSLSGATYTTAAITESCAITASFSPGVIVTGIASAGGTISPATQTLEPGSTATLTVTANNGYNIGTVTGCGGSLSGNSYTTGTLTASCAVTANFSLVAVALPTVTVTSTAGAGGTITPASQNIDQGATASLTVSPNAGFSIDSVSGCGGSLNGTTYTTTSLFTNCAVSATFRALYTVTGTAGVGGNINPTTQSVADGDTAMLTVTPDSGYYIDSISGCDGTLDAGTNYTSAEVSADCTVNVTFAERTAVFAGGSQSCVVLADGNAKCWGQNSSGQLGVSSFSLTARGDQVGESPVTNTILDLPDPSLTINTMSVGSQHACAILSDRNLYCWGEGQNGQTGLGINSDRKTMTTAVNFSGETVAEVSANGQHTCARLENNEVYCWGLNSSGELGTGDFSTLYIPFGNVVLADTPLQIATGAAHSCARLANNTVYCWGDNSSGQLGDNNGGVDSTTPSQVTLPVGTVTDIDAGGLHSCMIIDTNVYCWGENGAGQLGNNDGTNTDLDVLSAPLNLGGAVPVKLALGGEHSCVLTTVGSVYCWGESDAGQTGQNDVTDDLAPLLLNFGAYTVTNIDAGGDHTCVRLLPDDALDTSRPIRCWGEGGVGQLGLENPSDIGDDEVIDNDAFNLNF